MKTIIIACIGLLIAFSACQKASYLTDDGLHNAQVSQNTYDYLASHPNHMFDSLLMIIDHFGLQEEINNAKTFWVPSDYSVSRFYKYKRDSVLNADENATYAFAEFLDELDVDSVRAYIYNDGEHSLASANTTYTFINNNAAIDGFAYQKQRQPQGQWSYQDIYYLYYVKVRGEPDQTAPDGSIRVDRNDLPDMRILCQTAGIKTASGTTLNVLASTHTFVLDFASLSDDGPFIEDLDNGIRFTYDLSFRVSDAYTGTTVTASSAWIADAFGIEADEISSLMGSSVIFYAIEANGGLTNNYTANVPGHWFDGSGNVVAWGTDARLFSEYDASTFTFSIGQYPSRLAVGDRYTIRQALVYTNRNNQQIRAEFVFNITIN
ncbi:DUF4859 domain-containing protein [Parapedobacter sp. ISTM3]|uniref:DUF4859 domain-containing protein n=1 Tax=Parapedobacter sp. ISTM3 TaxID=2800130 RepID=UPI001907306C|nr:DUF4859 domain-containing protein [Parapedobacter sp. ISTM3]MBK1438697.1 DUF4859 domain-containing protein [Parapedobacter sp. ISTM3]